MAESSSKTPATDSPNDASNNNPPNDVVVTEERLRSLINAAKEAAAANPVPPADNGVTADVAMTALMEIEEESYRESLADPDITEEERDLIMAKLNGNKVHRRWLAFQKTVDAPSPSTEAAPEPDSISASK